MRKFRLFFCGLLPGVFVLAIGTKRTTGRGTFWGLLAGIASVALVNNYLTISFLWHNLIGCAVVVVVGMSLSLTDRRTVGQAIP